MKWGAWRRREENQRWLVHPLREATHCSVRITVHTPSLDRSLSTKDFRIQLYFLHTACVYLVSFLGYISPWSFLLEELLSALSQTVNRAPGRTGNFSRPTQDYSSHHEPGGRFYVLRTTAGFSGGCEEGQYQGAALIAAKHDKLRVQCELVWARGSDSSASVCDRWQLGVSQTLGQVWGRHPTGQQGGMERVTHCRIWGSPGHCAIPHHQGQVLVWHPVICCQVIKQKTTSVSRLKSNKTKLQNMVCRDCLYFTVVPNDQSEQTCLRNKVLTVTKRAPALLGQTHSQQRTIKAFNKKKVFGTKAFFLNVPHIALFTLQAAAVLLAEEQSRMFQCPFPSSIQLNSVFLGSGFDPWPPRYWNFLSYFKETRHLILKLYAGISERDDMEKRQSFLTQIFDRFQSFNHEQLTVVKYCTQ